MNYGRSTRSWKLWKWVKHDLILSMSHMYINSNLNPLKKFTSSSRSTDFKDILSWNISQKIKKTIPIRTGIAIGYTMKRGILLSAWWKSNGNWDNNMIRIAQWKSTVEQILASEEINKFKRAELWESQSGIQVWKLTIWVMAFEIIKRFTRSISFTRKGKPVLIMDVSKSKNIIRWVDRVKLIHVRWNRIKTINKDEEGNQ